MDSHKHIVRLLGGPRAVGRPARTLADLDAAKAHRFLWSEHPELRQRKPVEVALTELGAREVEEVIQRGLHGSPV